MHVDAYRLGDGAELDDLDLDESLRESVTVVEWGAGLAEQLTEERLELTLVRSSSAAEDEQGRTALLRAVGSRWAEVLSQVGRR